MDLAYNPVFFFCVKSHTTKIIHKTRLRFYGNKARAALTLNAYLTENYHVDNLNILFVKLLRMQLRANQNIEEYATNLLDLVFNMKHPVESDYENYFVLIQASRTILFL